MAEVVHDTQQEFWRPPSVLDPVPEAALSPARHKMAEACGGCGSEFLIGAKFCHTCGRHRPVLTMQPVAATSDAAAVAGFWIRCVAWAKSGIESAGVLWNRIPFPDWLHYLHFHEIKHWVGLSTAALIAFIIGLGCAAGALGVSLFYKPSTLAEFQAIQMWRIEWLLAATASFVAGILLKKPSQ